MIPLNTALEDIGSAIGYSATNRLVDWFGGTYLYVPDHADAEHQIAKVIGLPAMVHLCKYFGRTVLSLPVDYQREVTRRNRMICSMLQHGLGENEISRMTFISGSMVRKIRLQLEGDGLLPMILTGKGKQKGEGV